MAIREPVSIARSKCSATAQPRALGLKFLRCVTSAPCATARTSSSPEPRPLFFPAADTLERAESEQPAPGRTFPPAAALDGAVSPRLQGRPAPRWPSRVPAASPACRAVVYRRAAIARVLPALARDSAAQG